MHAQQSVPRFLCCPGASAAVHERAPSLGQGPPQSPPLPHLPGPQQGPCCLSQAPPASSRARCPVSQVLGSLCTLALQTDHGSHCLQDESLAHYTALLNSSCSGEPVEMPILGSAGPRSLSCLSGGAPVGLVTLMRLVLSPHPEERLSAALRGHPSSPVWSPPPLPRGAVFTALVSSHPPHSGSKTPLVDPSSHPQTSSS